MNARKLVIDCDPGIDDSLALMLAAASKELDLVGITTVSGNVPASMGAKNALKILSMIGKPDVPVYVGEETPLVLRGRDGHPRHGRSRRIGLAGCRRPYAQQGRCFFPDRNLKSNP